MNRTRSLFTIAGLLALPTFGPVTWAGEEPTLEQRLARLTEELEAARIKAHVPGMSIAVVKDGEIVLTRGFGLADLEEETPADEETIYAVGSTTKSFTATLAGMLVDEEEMSWDSPVTDFLPYFNLEVRSEDEDAACTMRDLLSHRHGFSRMSLLWIGDELSREEILRTAAGAEPWDDFRKGFHYCNVTYLAAGEAVGAAADSTWDELMVERIFEPLGMTSSTLTTREALEDPRLASGYRWGEHDEEYDLEPRVELERIGPAGSINSNVLDMAQWVRLQLGKGEVDGKRLISAERLEETWRSQIKITDGLAYALGWMLRTHDGRLVVEHGGNIHGFSAQIAMVPSEGVGYVLLMNLSASPLQQGSIPLVLDVLLDEWPDEEPVASSVEDIDYEAFAGKYVAKFATFDNEEFEVQVKDGGALALNIPSQMTFDLKQPDDEGKWYFVMTNEIAVTFERDERDAVVGLTLHQSGFSFDVPRKGRVVQPDAPDEVLAPYAGTYVHPEKGKPLEIALAGGRLAVVDGSKYMPIHAPDAEGYSSLRSRDDMGVSFERDAEGSVVSLTFHGGEGDRQFVRQGGPDAEELPSLEEVLALRDAEARAAALESAGGIRVSGRLLIPQAGLEGRMSIVVGGAHRYAQRMDFGKFGRVRMVADGDQAWSLNPLTGRKTLEGKELTQAFLGHPLSVEGDWRDYYDEIQVVRNDTVDERPVHVLRLSKADFPSRVFWVDAETGDVLRMNQTLVEGTVRLPATVTYGDFEETDGLRWAKRVRTENPATGSTVFEVESVETGLDLGPEHFRLEDPGGE